MAEGIPDKDIEVAASLLAKLASVESESEKLKSELTSVKTKHDELAKMGKVRGSYIDVLKEIAAEVGGDVEEHDASEVETLKSRLSELSGTLKESKAELARLSGLAERLKESSHDFFKLADERAKSKKTDAAAAQGVGKEKFSPSVKNANFAVEMEPPDLKLRDPLTLMSIFEIERLRKNRNLKSRGKVSPTLILDATNIIYLVKRYNPELVGGLDRARDILLCDADSLSGDLDLDILVVFDSEFEPTEKSQNQMTMLQCEGRKEPDKEASNRQIHRYIEEAQITRRPVILVSNDLDLTRDIAPLGAVNLTLQEVFKDA